jgi:HD-GYP domain-containing protein (c-di-GMP phosphodiesterase class II)/ABC-type amino acid transport substrate-binding protein
MAGQSFPSGRWRLSFRVTVVGMFLVVTALTAAVAVALQYHFSTRLAGESALSDYRQTAARTGDYLAATDRDAISIMRLLAAEFDANGGPRASRRTLSLLASTLRGHATFYAVYFGFPNGDLYDLINLDSGPEVRHRLQAGPEDRWVLMTIGDVGGKRVRRYAYYDKNFRLRTTRAEASAFRATSRSWYRQATRAAVHKTAPYLFQSLQRPGQTYSIRLNSGAVLAADVTLASLSAQLAGQLRDPQSRVYLYQPDGELIASNEVRSALPRLPAVKPLPLTPSQRTLVAGHPVLTVSSLTNWPPFDYSVAGQPQGYSVDMLSLISGMTGLRFRFVNGPSWAEFLRQFHAGEIDILQSVLRPGDNTPLGVMTKAYVHAPFGVLTRRDARPVHDIEQLFGKRVAIPAGWSIIDTLRKRFPQVHVVEVNSVGDMFEAVRKGKVDAGIDTAAQLRYTLSEFFYGDVRVDAPLRFGTVSIPDGLHYAVQPSLEGVAQLMDEALAHVTPAQRAALHARWLDRQTQAPKQGARATVPYQQLISMTSEPGALNRMQRLVLDGRDQFVFLTTVGGTGSQPEYFTVVTPVSAVYAQAYSEVRKALLATAGILLLMLPVAYWLAGFIVRPVKLLAVEEEKIRDKRYGELKRVKSNIIEIDDLALTQRSMARSIERHAKEQEALMDAFIQLIAQAIDEKSHYTGAHCARVPELAMMLVRKADASGEEPFRQFHFASEAEWREFRIGAWLHDCGKITTPEHIVDKGSKLETIYNRIHEIRTRFEVLWRDAVIRYWERRLQRPQDEAALRAELDREQAELQEQFAFIAACNQGSEHMDEADIARLERLADITWQRHFDDRLGLSPVEAARFSEPPQALPVTEKLLADKPWQVLTRTGGAGYPSHLGIRMEVPPLEYNRGELYNLTIQRGTLTAEDRFKINEHIISTIRMLDSLPLPEDLARVPRYASTHHETLDGRGYPRRLTAEDLSMPERIMVLADVFEALTAADRPYKKAKPISVAIDILHGMVLDKHVDRDVFELFLRSGVYLDYARRFLPESQIDAVDLTRYLS